MKSRLLKWMTLTMVTGPMVGIAGPLEPILLPTGTGEEPDSTEIGDDPPDSPKDPGNIQPVLLVVAESSGPILVPTGPWDRPDETSIGDPPPSDPKDKGDIQPEQPALA